jgi:hypothetical protein
MTAMENDDRKRRLRRKNLTLLFALLGFALLVYLVSIVRMGMS